MSKVDQILKEQRITEDQLQNVKKRLEKDFPSDDPGNRLNNRIIRVRIFGRDSVFIDSSRSGMTITKDTALQMANWLKDLLGD